MTTETLRCTGGCGETKPLRLFTSRSRALCQACWRRRRRADLRPDEVRAAHLWRAYRLRPHEYAALREAQDYRCGVCGVHEDHVDPSTVGGRKRRDGRPAVKLPLAVDHCHGTGRIRGLLCPPCNAGLAALRDSPARLEAAAAYLERVTEDPPPQPAGGPRPRIPDADVRGRSLWRHYRMTSAEYDAVRRRQGHRCGVCGTHEEDVDTTGVGGRPRADGRPSVKIALAVDHCHRSGVVRGLLCAPCNRGLGLFADDARRLRAGVRWVTTAPPHPA